MNSVGLPSLSINGAKLYDLVVTLSTEDNAKLLKMDSGLKRTITWYKTLVKVTIQVQIQWFHFLIDPSFYEINRAFVLPLQDATYRNCIQNIMSQVPK